MKHLLHQWAIFNREYLLLPADRPRRSWLNSPPGGLSSIIVFSLMVAMVVTWGLWR